MSTLGRRYEYNEDRYYPGRPVYSTSERSIPYAASDRPIYPTADRSMRYAASDRPEYYGGDRQWYYASGAPAPAPPSESRVVFEHKKMKLGPCAWIGLIIFIIFIIVLTIILIILFTTGRTIENRVQYENNHPA